MPTDLKKSLANLEDACQLHGFNLELIDLNDNKSMCNTIKINGYAIEGIRTFDNEDVNMIVDLLINYDFKDLKKVFPQTHKSMSKSLGEYVKDSYNFSKMNLSELFRAVLKGSSYASDKFESLKDARVNHVYTSDSAFLFKGYYITPCILQATINEVLKGLSKTSMKLYMDAYGYNKKDIKVMTEDIMQDYFVKENCERFSMIDSLINADRLQGIGV